MTGGRLPDPALLSLSEAAGLAPMWRDVHGHIQEVDATVLRSMLDALGLPCSGPGQLSASLRQLEGDAQLDTGSMLITSVNETFMFAYTGSLAYTLVLEDGKHYAGEAMRAGPGTVRLPGIGQPGYHQLLIGDMSLTIAVAPDCSYLPLPVPEAGAGAWGVAAQVYSLRPSRSTCANASSGIPDAPTWPGWETGGDFGLLAKLVHNAAQSGACAVAISPVHAMFSADPLRYSPYAPSSRLFLNTAYIQPSIVLGRDVVERAVHQMSQAGVYSPPDTTFVDWSITLTRRLALLRHLFDDFCAHSPAALTEAYRAFRRRGGEALESHAHYEALHADYAVRLGAASGWQDWPAHLHDPQGQGVKAYAVQHEAEVSFHVFLQWLADEGMQFAQQSARAAGMSVGLIADLAIGTDARGSHAWSRQGEILAGVSVGAPPDLFQPDGQSWGLTAFSPRALRRNSYAAFIETLRAVLRHAGGIRIDHILGMARMWLVPSGAKPTEGVYLRYPMQDMLRLLILEAWRHQALVVGENLGTVPEGFNDKLEQQGILGTSVLWFERSPAALLESEAQSDFLPPSQWPAWTMATPTTHDLPTIAGWWAGRDLEWRAYSRQAHDLDAHAAASRVMDKTALWQALQEAGCVQDGTCLPAQAPLAAVLSYVGKTPSPLVIVSLEDLLGLLEQPNLPGTSGAPGSSHPNWVQCLPVGVDDIFDHPNVISGVAAIKLARRKS